MLGSVILMLILIFVSLALPFTLHLPESLDTLYIIKLTKYFTVDTLFHKQNTRIVHFPGSTQLQVRRLYDNKKFSNNCIHARAIGFMRPHESI
ncbi:hypothetical protein SAMN05216403_10796 [Nitrosospira multiformis ATCC 25196]|uniref:Uncharacterized protein n=1 Tax=Nitrosospira multiformis (strain ATCC 25196 / NCIMB 11849 / C 71) TaxID=323848 RepID=A0A1H5UHR5_NITMU|nr:hypothetical protein SAMN05216411_102126 [Nitrosospira multiformis]SEF73807.1 hypothetical protein SAMN05216403_10796 [Nitrosospira multiformis ATCC 25196]